MKEMRCHYQFTRNDLYPVFFNAQGIPRVYLPGIGMTCHPITVANWGLHFCNSYVDTKDDLFLKKAVDLADWLVRNHQHGIWFMNFPNDFFHIKPPWPCAMVQGQAISLMARLGSLLKNEAYVDLAVLALEPFTKTVAEGGVTNCTEAGDVYEEYPSTPPSIVLNGFVFTLFGLYDLWCLHGINKAKSLYEKGLGSLEKLIGQYDTGYWTRYDLYPTLRLASQEYHRLHIALLDSLSRITGKSKFLTLAKKWRRYRNSTRSQVRWLTAKVIEKFIHPETRSPLKLRIR